MAIDISEAFSKVPGGGGQGSVIRSLVCGLAALDGTTTFTLFSIRRASEAPAWLAALPGNFHLAWIRTRDPRALVYRWHFLRAPAVDAILGPQDVVHATSGASIPACRRARLLVTVHDLVWWRLPWVLRPWGRVLLRRGLRVAVREASAIAAVSGATRRDLVEYFGDRLAVGKVFVVHNGIEDPLAPPDPLAAQEIRQGFGIRRPYLLFAGTIEPRKNLASLLEAYAALEPEFRDNYSLVIMGPRGWKMSSPDRLAGRLFLEANVIWTGFVSPYEREALLTGATLLVYPSLYEGFGLPIVEAMARGIPVVTSNVSAMPEVAGEAALLVDPTDCVGIREAIRRLLQDAGLRESLARRGRQQAAHFSSRRMAADYLALYHALVEKAV